MDITVIGDFADPLSFLASQRVDQVRSLGLHDIRWLAVEGVRARPLSGEPLDDSTVELVRRLSRPGEAVPAAGVGVPNSRAATAAYAESVTDGVPNAMRRALFDAVWVQATRVADPDVIRSIVFAVLNDAVVNDAVVNDAVVNDAVVNDKAANADAVDRRVVANEPLVPLGRPDPFATSRRLGFVVSMGRGPLTQVGQRRVDHWRQLWQQHGMPPMPLLLTESGDAFAGDHALQWLASRLPQHEAPQQVPQLAHR